MRIVIFYAFTTYYKTYREDEMVHEEKSSAQSQTSSRSLPCYKTRFDRARTVGAFKHIADGVDRRRSQT